MKNTLTKIQQDKGSSEGSPTSTELSIPPQQTQNICITFVQRRLNVLDIGPTL